MVCAKPLVVRHFPLPPERKARLVVSHDASFCGHRRVYGSVEVLSDGEPGCVVDSDTKDVNLRIMRLSSSTDGGSSNCVSDTCPLRNVFLISIMPSFSRSTTADSTERPLVLALKIPVRVLASKELPEDPARAGSCKTCVLCSSTHPKGKWCSRKKDRTRWQMPILQTELH